MVGPWGGLAGDPWDDGVNSGVRQIIIAHGVAIDSIQIEYDLRGGAVWSEKHGTASGNSKTDQVRGSSVKSRVLLAAVSTLLVLKVDS